MGQKSVVLSLTSISSKAMTLTLFKVSIYVWDCIAL